MNMTTNGNQTKIKKRLTAEELAKMWGDVESDLQRILPLEDGFTAQLERQRHFKTV